jgi:sentrin-specific protease 1
LQRALENAKATLNRYIPVSQLLIALGSNFVSPKPPRPFFPTLEQLQISRRTKDEDIEKRIRPPVRPLPSKLPPEDEKKVDEVIRTRGFTSKFAREQVSQSDLTRLLPGQWLNDEIINFYGAMLLGRSENCKENPVAVKGKKGRNAPLNIHYFSSFFWAKLAKEGYDKGRLAKWTKKVHIYSLIYIGRELN